MPVHRQAVRSATQVCRESGPFFRPAAIPIVIRCRPGDVAASPKGDGNGHVLHNRSDAPCCFVAIGKPAASDCHYPDIDMHLTEGRGFHRKNGSDF